MIVSGVEALMGNCTHEGVRAPINEATERATVNNACFSQSGGGGGSGGW